MCTLIRTDDNQKLEVLMRIDDRIVILIKVILWGMDGWYISANDSGEIFGKDVRHISGYRYSTYFISDGIFLNLIVLYS